MTLLKAFGPRLAGKRRPPTVQVFQGHWQGSNLQRKVSSNFATDFNIKTASAATAAEARGDGRPPSVVSSRRLPLGRSSLAGGQNRLTPQVLERTPPGPSNRDTASVVFVALALFREELRKHLCFLDTFSLEAGPLPSPTERSHVSASA